MENYLNKDKTIDQLIADIVNRPITQFQADRKTCTVAYISNLRIENYVMDKIGHKLSCDQMECITQNFANHSNYLLPQKNIALQKQIENSIYTLARHLYISGERIEAYFSKPLNADFFIFTGDIAENESWLIFFMKAFMIQYDYLNYRHFKKGMLFRKAEKIKYIEFCKKEGNKKDDELYHIIVEKIRKVRPLFSKIFMYKSRYFTDEKWSYAFERFLQTKTYKKINITEGQKKEICGISRLLDHFKRKLYQKISRKKIYSRLVKNIAQYEKKVGYSIDDENIQNYVHYINKNIFLILGKSEYKGYAGSANECNNYYKSQLKKINIHVLNNDKFVTDQKDAIIFGGTGGNNRKEQKIFEVQCLESLQEAKRTQKRFICTTYFPVSENLKNQLDGNAIYIQCKNRDNSDKFFIVSTEIVIPDMDAHPVMNLIRCDINNKPVEKVTGSFSEILQISKRYLVSNYKIASLEQKDDKKCLSTYFGVKISPKSVLKFDIVEILNRYLNSLIKEYKNCEMQSLDYSIEFTFVLSQCISYKRKLIELRDNCHSELNEEIEKIKAKYPNLKEIISLETYKKKTGIYVMVLDEYNVCYIGQSIDVKRRILQHWNKNNYFSGTGIDMFGAYDTTRIFVLTCPKDNLDDIEYNMIQTVKEKYTLNVIRSQEEMNFLGRLV